MRDRVFVGVSLVALLASCTRSEPVGVVPRCSQTQLLGYVPGEDEVTAHRQFSLPFVNYAFGTKRSELWGLVLTVRVDPSGRVVCYRAKGDLFGSGTDRLLKNESRAALDGFRGWSYRPFVKDGGTV